MKIEKVFFLATDGVRLFGLLHLPDSIVASQVVIGVHGYSSSSTNHNRDDEIAKKLTESGIAYFGFDNRGSGIIRKMKIVKDVEIKKFYGGSAYDKVTDAKCDILGAIDAMKKYGFEKFILQGHSLGSSKTLLTYLDLVDKNNTDVLNIIQAVILLSPVDIKNFLEVKEKENFEKFKQLAKEKINKGEGKDIILDGLLIAPISAETFDYIFTHIDEINIPVESNGGWCDKFNKIKCPLMICYAENDMTISPTNEILEKAKQKITNDKLKCVVIKNTNHLYSKKEQELADEILKFVKFAEQ